MAGKFEDVDKVFDDLRSTLQLLDGQHIQSEHASKQIEVLGEENKNLLVQMDKLKLANIEIQRQLMSQTNKVNNRGAELVAQNEAMRVQIAQLVEKQQTASAAYETISTELEKVLASYNDVVEKMNIWKRVHQAMYIKQKENQTKMVDLAIRIGYSKATILYVKSLKRQVQDVYRTSSATIQFIQELSDKCTTNGLEAGVLDWAENISGNKRGGEASEASNGSHTDGNKQLRSDAQNYQWELLMELQALRQLSEANTSGTNVET